MTEPPTTEHCFTLQYLEDNKVTVTLIVYYDVLLLNKYCEKTKLYCVCTEYFYSF